jgi:hypothetical protein
MMMVLEQSFLHDDDGAKVDMPTGDDTSEGIPPELDG